MKVLKGSYTVEAALILPGIFIILLGILYLAFYVHDAVWIQGAAYESAFMGANGGVLEDWRVRASNRQGILEYLEAKVENRQILPAVMRYEALEEEKRVSVSIQGKRTVSASVSKPSGASYVRKMGRFIKILQSLDGQEE